MQKKKIIIDCDPGYDDAVAILLAAGNPLIDVLAITTVAGNQTLEKVTRNALRIAKLAHLAHCRHHHGRTGKKRYFGTDRTANQHCFSRSARTENR